MEDELDSGWEMGLEDAELVVDEDQLEVFSAGEIKAEEEILESHVDLSPPSWWQRLIGFFWKSPETRSTEQSRRLHELNVTIELYPDAPTSYMLRGEIFAERREYHLAAADFEKAIELASEQIDLARWGIVEQTLLDRTRHQLQQVRRRL